MKIDFPYMPLYFKDWLTGEATTAMTAEQEGAFLRLLLHAWGSNPPCTIPNDSARLAALSKLGSRWKKVGPFLLEQFESVDNNRLRNRKQWEVYCELIENRNKRSTAGRKGNEVRWGDRSQRDPNATDVRPPRDQNANRKRSPSSASASSSARTDYSASNEAGAGAPPSFPQQHQSTAEDPPWNRVLMPVLRDCGFEADARDGSVCKALIELGISTSQIETIVRGLGMMRDKGRLAFLHIKPGENLNMRMLASKIGTEWNKLPLWSDAEAFYAKHAPQEETGGLERPRIEIKGFRS